MQINTTLYTVEKFMKLVETSLMRGVLQSSIVTIYRRKNYFLYIDVM